MYKDKIENLVAHIEMQYRFTLNAIFLLESNACKMYFLLNDAFHAFYAD